jgi:RNA-binding protein PNO1
MGARVETDVEMHVDEEGRPNFSQGKDIASNARIETRKVPIPPHRMTPLKASWPQMCMSCYLFSRIYIFGVKD